MHSTPDNDDATITIDSGGVLARWADWKARGIQVPVATIGRRQSPLMTLVADEILVDGQDRRLIDEVARLGAVVMPERPLLPPPAGLRPRTMDRDFPAPVRMRFPSPPRVEGAVHVLTDLVRRRDAARGELTFTSEAAASLACVVARYAAEGRRIGLNALGTPAALPLAAPIEGDGCNSLNDWAFAGRSRIVEAWQLVESRRAVAPVEPIVWIAILDGGFWLDAAGIPLGQPSDFGAAVPQVNLIDEGSNASGTNPVKGGSTWHGNKVASAAVATVGNTIGAAGAGGTVGRPIFFRSRMTAHEVLRCLMYCTAWGLDILNMSFTIESSEFFFDTSGWNDAFNFAIAHGVVPVAAAGNEARELPDYNVRPATRTPGTITVAAHDASDNAAGYSNYGSSITIWAPDTVPVVSDGDGGNLTPASGTSIAAPLVAGVAAMMRAVNPGLDALAIRNLIAQTGWQGTGRVSKGLDAYAAVLAAMGNSLPDWHEPNNTRENASPLATLAPGTLGPTFSGLATRSGLGDDDWWQFTVQEFTDATITVESYPRLGPCLVELHPDDPDSQVLDDLEEAHSLGKTTLTALLPPDTYRIRIAGNRPSLYDLKVRTKPATLSRDEFEPNNSFETTAPLLFAPRDGAFLVAREWGPGVFRATLHRTSTFGTNISFIDVDYFRFDVPSHSVFAIPTVRVFGADLPIEVTLFDASHAVLNQWPASRAPIEIVPPGLTTCFLKVAGASATRYRISIGLEVDEDAIPEPHQKPFEIFPPWWIDNPLRLAERVTDYYVDIRAERALGERMAFESPGQPITIELIDVNGALIRTATPSARGGLEIDLGGVAPAATSFAPPGCRRRAPRVARRSTSASGRPYSNVFPIVSIHAPARDGGGRRAVASCPATVAVRANNFWHHSSG